MATFSVSASPDRESPAFKSVCILLSQEPVVAYKGHLPGLPATKVAPSVPFNAKSPSVRLYLEYLEKQQSALAKQITSIDPGFQLRGRFNLLVNILIGDLDPLAWDKVKALPGVLAVVPEMKFHPCLNASNELMNVPLAWSEFGGDRNAGRGIKIAILDTGIDVTHPMFIGDDFDYPPGFPLGDPTLTNKKIIVANAYPLKPRENVTARDYNGHGTHVAACAAGNPNVQSPLGILSGVAPGAWLGNYNVFPHPDDVTTEYQVLAALEDVVLDGMDIVNMSFVSDDGIAVEPAFNPLLLAIRNLTAMGTVVVVAAGNDGQNGLKPTLGYPAQSPEAITVGSISNSHRLLTSSNPRELDLRFTQGAQAVLGPFRGLLAVDTVPLAPAIQGTFPLKSADWLVDGVPGEPKDAVVCSPLPVESANGAWVLIASGGQECSVQDQLLHLVAAGAVGVIVFPLNGPERPDLSLVDVSIPVFALTQSEGLQVFQMLSVGSSGVTVTSEAPSLNVQNGTEQVISSFSSRGPAMRGVIKPDVVAVGQYSYAAVQNDIVTDSNRFHATGFRFVDGTSFAAPRVSGIATLVRQIHPEWTVEQIRSALILQADAGGTLAEESVNLRGAGLAMAADSLQPLFLANPPLLSFGNEEMSHPVSVVTRTVVLEPLTAAPLVAQVSPIVRLNAENAHIEVSPQEIHLVSGQPVILHVTLTVLAPKSEFVQDIEGGFRFIAGNEILNGEINFFHRSLAIVPFPEGTQVLFVDDDGGENYELDILPNIEAAGHPYTVWDVESMDRFPDRSLIQTVKTVVWYMGPYSLNDTFPDGVWQALDRRRVEWLDTLLTYLESGGTLLLEGQDYTDIPMLVDESNQYGFTHHILQLQDLIKDTAIDRVGSAAGGRLALDISDAVLDAPFDLYVDELVPDYSSNVVVPEFVDAMQSDAVVGYSLQTSRYRALCYAFPLLGLDEPVRGEVIAKSLDWLLSHQPGPYEIHSLEVLQTSTWPNGFQLKVHGLGFSTPVGWLIQVGDRPLIDVTRIDEGLLSGTLSQSPPPGTYDVTVTSPGGLSAVLSDGIVIRDDGTVGIEHWAVY